MPSGSPSSDHRKAPAQHAERSCDPHQASRSQTLQDLAIDYLCGHFTEDNIRRNFFESSESEIFEAVGRLKNLRGYSAPEFLAHLETLGIGRIVIPTLL